MMVIDVRRGQVVVYLDRPDATVETFDFAPDDRSCLSMMEMGDALCAFLSYKLPRGGGILIAVEWDPDGEVSPQKAAAFGVIAGVTAFKAAVVEFLYYDAEFSEDAEPGMSRREWLIDRSARTQETGEEE
jgi:hypothetical protein